MGVVGEGGGYSSRSCFSHSCTQCDVNNSGPKQLKYFFSGDRRLTPMKRSQCSVTSNRRTSDQVVDLLKIEAYSDVDRLAGVSTRSYRWVVFTQ